MLLLLLSFIIVRSHCFPICAEVLFVVRVRYESSFEKGKLVDERLMTLCHVNFTFSDGLDQIDYLWISYFGHGVPLWRHEVLLSELLWRRRRPWHRHFATNVRLWNNVELLCKAMLYFQLDYGHNTMEKINVKPPIVSEDATQAIEFVESAISLFVPRSDVFMKIVSWCPVSDGLFGPPKGLEEPLTTISVASISNTSFYVGSYQMCKLMFKHLFVLPASWKGTIDPDYLAGCNGSSNLICKPCAMKFVTVPALPPWSPRLIDWAVLSVNAKGPIVPITFKPHIKID